MKKWIVALAVALALSYAHAEAQTGLVTVDASNLVNSSGAALSGATVSFAPVNSSGDPLSYRIDGKGQSIDSAVTAQVSGGAFSVVIADTSLTSPVNVCFKVSVTDNSTGASLLGPGYSCVQPAYSNSWCAAGICNFDNYTPNAVPGALVSAPTFQVGAVTSLPVGSVPTVSLSGSAPSYTLNFGIPATDSKPVFVATLGSQSASSSLFNCPNSFTWVPFSTAGTIVTDTASGWDAGANDYVIPITGTYLIVTRLRVHDNATSGISYGEGAVPDINHLDGVSWFVTVDASNSSSSRNGSENVRIAHLSKGSTLNEICYGDYASGVGVMYAEMDITLLSTP